MGQRCAAADRDSGDALVCETRKADWAESQEALTKPGQALLAVTCLNDFRFSAGPFPVLLSALSVDPDNLEPQLSGGNIDLDSVTDFLSDHRLTDRT